MEVQGPANVWGRGIQAGVEAELAAVALDVDDVDLQGTFDNGRRFWFPLWGMGTAVI